jgi:hypothetical protein
MDDQRPTTNDQRPTAKTGTRWSSFVVGRWSFVVGFVVLLALIGCSTAPASAPGDQIPVGGGTTKPEDVAQYFFDDLGKALKDPALTNDERRGEIVEQLASYFAPNERDDQRVALRSALDSFVNGLDKLEPDETLTLELRFERIEKLYENGDRAMVRPINGTIYVLITRTTNGGVLTVYEDTVGLGKILGRDDAGVPVIRIGRNWFLTEG